MSDEEKKPEVKPEKDDKKVAETSKEVEEIAMKLGWNPDHTGDDRPYVGPKEFILRSREIQDTTAKQLRATRRETSDLKIINEAHPYITKLKDIANNQQSFYLLVEVFSLQAKLKLITFEFKEAQILLNQALDTAEKNGLNRLAKRITNEQDELSKNFIRWEKMKVSGANISERMDLARIDEQIKSLLRKRMYLKKITNQA